MQTNKKLDRTVVHAFSEKKRWVRHMAGGMLYSAHYAQHAGGKKARKVDIMRDRILKQVQMYSKQESTVLSGRIDQVPIYQSNHSRFKYSNARVSPDNH